MKVLNTIVTLLVLLLTTHLFSQTNPNKTMTNQQTVEKFLNGFNDPSEIEESLALLSDDYHFENPMVALKSKSEFIELAQQIGSVLTGLKIIQMAEKDGWVVVLYEFNTNIAGLEVNLATEWFRVENKTIHESLLIYDATKWRALYAQMEE